MPSKLLASLRVLVFHQQATSWLRPTLIALEFTYGEHGGGIKRFESQSLNSLGCPQRANRAQYAEVSLQSFDEDKLLGGAIPLPAMEGEDEDDGTWRNLTTARLQLTLLCIDT